MDTFHADLHCHTYISDGSDSPEELIRLAIEKGLSGLSITDHDTVGAYSRALTFAEQQSFPLLPGVEFSASFRGDSVHILGYAFSLKSEEIKQFCEGHFERRRHRNSKILEHLKQLGISIEEEELENIGQMSETVGRPHIAMLLVQKGVVKSLKEAFGTFLGEGKPAYDPGEAISVEKTIEVIHKAKGKAVLAHPHLIKRSSTLKAMLEMPFDGIEGHYPRLTPIQQNRWAELAKEKKWILTGGSDYHGNIKPQNNLGAAWIGKETFELLYTHYVQIASSS
ncbi:MAG: PHP domain-containing protein [Chlamydiales bacterium]